MFRLSLSQACPAFVFNDLSHWFFNKSNMTCVSSGSWTACLSRTHELTPVFSGVRDTRSIIFCVVFCRSLFVILRFYFWPLYYLSFFYLRLLITPLVIIFQYTLDYLATFAVSKMASYIFVWSKNLADIRDGNEYKIRKWLVLKFHGSGHLPNHTASK